MFTVRIGHAEIVRSTDYHSIAIQNLYALNNCLAVDERLELFVLRLEEQVATSIFNGASLILNNDI